MQAIPWLIKTAVLETSNNKTATKPTPPNKTKQTNNNSTLTEKNNKKYMDNQPRYKEA